MGDNRPCKIVGYGGITMKLPTGIIMNIYNIRYIPNIKRSLLSLGTLEKASYHVSLKYGTARVIKGSLIVY